VLGLFLISLAVGAVTGEQLYYRLSYLWAFMLVGSWLWARFALWGVTISRLPRSTRAQVGQIFEERFEIYNPGRLPRFWVVVRDESPLPGAQGSRLFTLLGGRRRRTYLARTHLTRRGVYPLGPTWLESSDPFGLFPVSRPLPVDDVLLVYPLLAELDSFPSPAGILPGGEALRRRTHQVTPNAAEVRDYAPGDPLNRIHWVSTARRDRLISKEFELDPQAEVWVFLDGNREVQAALEQKPVEIRPHDLLRRKPAASLAPSTEEYGVSAAGSIARYFLRQGRAVGLANSGQSFTMIPPDRGGRQLSKILEALALLRAEGNLPLLGLVEVQGQHLTRGCTVVIITASGGMEVILSADYLSRRGMRVVVVLINAETFSTDAITEGKVSEATFSENGGTTGGKELAETLRFMRIPLRLLRCGDDLGAALQDSLAPH
jgi:uncharacterized protein (DUF58 family)